MKISLLALIIGFIADLMFGDPRWLPHPVRLIGALINRAESFYRGILPKSKRGESIAGVLLMLTVVSLSTLIPILLLILANMLSPYLRLFIESVMCYQILATKSLKDESMKVYNELNKRDLGGAREKVSMIVGRDTDNLNIQEVTKATIETIAENASDGVIAPMIFMAIGGAPLGFFYKAVNTLDSMVGYKNDKYINLGSFSAKADDVLNIIPARLSAYIMIVASFIIGLDYKNAVKIYKRDRYNHSSPNSAHTEAVCAGALNIELAGSSYYFGKLIEKPTIGDPIREVMIEDIKTANNLMYATAWLCLALCAVIKLVFIVM